MDPQLEALRSLGELLRRAQYELVTVTPETHRRVNARASRQQQQAQSLRDVFGWNRPFAPQLLPAEMLDLMRAADVLEESPSGLRSRVRFSTLGPLLCVHSAFPTIEPDAVFFGPDTYRFCSLLARWAPRARRAVDVGCGSGAGGLSIADRVEQLVLADINPRALRYARVNAALAGRTPELCESDVLAAVDGSLDLIIANPPYMVDHAGRAYRDGGGPHGISLSERIVHESLPRLSAGGTLIVYTGSPVVAGRDQFRAALLPYLEAQAVHGAYTFEYEELDPDVFGEELDSNAYGEVERIAVVALRVTRSANGESDDAQRGAPLA